MINSNPRKKVFLTFLMLFIFCANTFSMEISVERTSGSTISLDVEPTDLIVDIKGKIFDQIGIPVEQQTLMFADKILEDTIVLADYNVGKGDTLQLIITDTSSVPIPLGIVILAFILIAILTVRHARAKSHVADLKA